MFMDQQSDNATTSTEPTSDSTDDDLVDDIMGQFDVDFDTLCIHVAERKQEELKAEGKHPHHRLMKRMANPVVAPPGDVRRLLGDKVKTIGSTPYKVKRAGTSPAPTDVDINGIIFYSVKMADCVYRVSTNNHQRQPVLSLTKVLMGVLQGTTVESLRSTINLTNTLTLRVLTGTSWSGADSSWLVQSPIPTVDP
jgi:hypothetical protein